MVRNLVSRRVARSRGREDGIASASDGSITRPAAARFGVTVRRAVESDVGIVGGAPSRKRSLGGPTRASTTFHSFDEAPRAIACGRAAAEPTTTMWSTRWSGTLMWVVTARCWLINGQSAAGQHHISGLPLAL